MSTTFTPICDPPPPLLSEALGLIVHHDAETRAELPTLVQKYRAEVRRKVEYDRDHNPILTPMPPGDMLRVFLAALPSLLLARRYTQFLDLVIGTPSLPPIAEDVRWVAELYAGEQAPAVLVALKAELRAVLAAELATVDAALARFAASTPRPANKPSNHPLPVWLSWVDLRVNEIAPLLGRRHDLVDRAERLRPGEPEPVKAAGLHIARVVKAAGGREAIAGRMAEARLLKGVFYDFDDAGPQLAEQERAVADLNRSLAKVGYDGANAPAPGSHASDLFAQRQTTSERVNTLRAEIEARQAKVIAATVDRACQGDDDARRALAETASLRVTAFPPGFAASLEWKGAANEPLEGLAAELLKRLEALPLHVYEPVPPV